MTCVRFLLACVLVAAACDDGLLETSTDPLTIELRLAEDTLVPGDRVATTAVIRNRLGHTVSFTGNTCVLGNDLLRADGSSIPVLQFCFDILQTWSIAPHDSLLVSGPWDATYVTAETATPMVVALPPGTYGLRPYIRANEMEVEGETAEVTVLPWGRARLVHTGSGLPPLDLVVGGRVAASGVTGGTTGGGGVVPAGRQTIELRADGQTLGTGEVVIGSAAGHTVAVRLVPGGNAEPWLVPDTGGVVGPDQSRLRVIHLASSAQPIDVWRTQPDYSAFVKVMFPFPYGSASPYLLSDAGEWRVLVTPAGGTDTLLLTGPMPLPGGHVGTLILMDDGNGGITASLISP